MRVKQILYDDIDYWQPEVPQCTVYENGDRESSVLDSFGKPYTVLKAKNPLGFQLRKTQ